jgi:arylsulfatase A-like enzyme
MRATRGDPIVIVTADHGESLGEHDFYFDHGDYVYAASVRVPLAIILPEAHPLHRTGRCAGWCTLVDVAPTILELVDPDLASGAAHSVEGRSLLPCFEDESLPPAPVFAESGMSYFPDEVRGRVRNDVAGRFRSVTHGPWKLIWTPFREDDEAWLLFDVVSDPNETRNLYRPDHPALPPLRAALEDWMARAPSEAPAPTLSPDDIETLRGLGYLEDP